MAWIHLRRRLASFGKRKKEIAGFSSFGREPPEHSADELVAAGVTGPEAVLAVAVGAAIAELKLLETAAAEDVLLAPMAA